MPHYRTVSMHIFTVPRLYCPFNQYITKYTAEIILNEYKIQEQTSAWILYFDLVSTREMFERYEAQKFANMIAVSYPFGKGPDLEIWCNLNTLLFLVDDMLDEQDILNSREQVVEFISNFISVLTTNKSYSIAENPVFAALGDIWQRLKSRSSEAFQEKLIKAIREMFTGGIWAYDHIATGKKPQLADYLAQRQYLGAANLATDSLTLTACINLPEDIYNQPIIRQLTEHCRNAICLANDLFSLGKEKEYNADFNVVSILENSGLSVNAAIKESAVLHNNVVRQFIKLAKTALVYDPETNKMVKKYIHALCALMAGNIIWSTQNTTRYPHRYGYKNKNH